MEREKERERKKERRVQYAKDIAEKLGFRLPMLSFLLRELQRNGAVDLIAGTAAAIDLTLLNFHLSLSSNCRLIP